MATNIQLQGSTVLKIGHDIALNFYVFLGNEGLAGPSGYDQKAALTVGGVDKYQDADIEIGNVNDFVDSLGLGWTGKSGPYSKLIYMRQGRTTDKSQKLSIGKSNKLEKLAGLLEDGDKGSLKTTFEKNPKVIDAIFKNQLTTDNADVSVKALGVNTKPGSFSITKSGGNFLIDGVTMSQNGTEYTSSSGDSTGIILNITDSNLSSANVYYGKSLMTLVDESLTNFLAFDGDIQNRLSGLSDNLKELAEQKISLDERMDKLQQRYAMQYASMETAVAGLKDTGDYLTEMLKSKD